MHRFYEQMQPRLASPANASPVETSTPPKILLLCKKIISSYYIETIVDFLIIAKKTSESFSVVHQYLSLALMLRSISR